MRVDPDDLLCPSEVAAALGLGNPGSVSVYRVRYPDFPAPVIEKGRCLLWHRADIEAWDQF